MEGQKVKKGIYEHYKGNRPILIGELSSHDGNQYEVIALAKHSETHEDMVVYQNVSDSNKIWVRPLAMFLEEIELPSCDDSSAIGLRGLHGAKVPRFKYLGN
ncbi:MAG: DUF1653 domain-containing protein [Patescibacteria group bacterium]